MKLSLIISLFCLLASFVFSSCSSRNQSGEQGWGADGYGQDQLDFAGLPQRQEGISMYGPGSENIRRDLVDPVYFAFDSYTVAAGEMPKIQQLAEIANGTLVIIAGHTDSVGTLEYNRGLGERRAMAVRKELLQMGVPTNNIQTISYGEEMLSGQGDYYDRRAEFGALMQ